MNLRVLIILSVASFTTSMMATPCVDQPLFELNYASDYNEVVDDFVSAGGDTNDFVNVNDVRDIFGKLAPHALPIKFKYKKKTRKAYALKFSVTHRCQLVVSRYEYMYKVYPSKNIHHHLLAQGNNVYSAGAIMFFHDGEQVKQVVIANRSSRFCPSFKSLQVVKNILVAGGVEASKIKLLNKPNKSCIETDEYE